MAFACKNPRNHVIMLLSQEEGRIYVGQLFEGHNFSVKTSYISFAKRWKSRNKLKLLKMCHKCSKCKILLCFYFFLPEWQASLVFLLQCYDYFYCLQYKGFSMGAKGEGALISQSVAQDLGMPLSKMMPLRYKYGSKNMRKRL